LKNNDVKLIYIHGGPGLNSHPDKVLLGSDIKAHGHDILFWNEPREFKTQDMYSEIVDDLVQTVLAQEKDVCLIGHSFGARIIIDSLSKLSEKVFSTIFLAPALNMMEGDKRIINYGLSKLEETNSEVANAIKENIPKLTYSKFDEIKGETLLMAFQSGYFSENFISSKDFENFFSHLQGEYEFRVPDHISIRKTAKYLKRGNGEFKDIHNLTIIGEKDPIFGTELEAEAVREFFPNANIQFWSNASHYPHIDDKKRFIEELNILKFSN
jgi:pimeloyl-ACP methyl ester carboxylesterase